MVNYCTERSGSSNGQYNRLFKSFLLALGKDTMTPQNLNDMHHEAFLIHAVEITRREENLPCLRSIVALMRAHPDLVWSIAMVATGFGRYRLKWQCYPPITATEVDSVFELPWETDTRRTPMRAWTTHSELFIQGTPDNNLGGLVVHPAYFNHHNPYIRAEFTHPSSCYCIEV